MLLSLLSFCQHVRWLVFFLSSSFAYHVADIATVDKPPAQPARLLTRLLLSPLLVFMTPGNNWFHTCAQLSQGRTYRLGTLAACDMHVLQVRSSR